MAKTTARASGVNRYRAGAGEEDHGDEDDADAERGDEGGDGDLLGAVENRAQQRFPLAEVAMDVLDLDRGVVHQDADGQREPPSWGSASGRRFPTTTARASGGGRWTCRLTF